MIIDKKNIGNYKSLSIRYKILKSNLQVLRSFMYTRGKIKSGKHYKSLIEHKREICMYNINNKDKKIWIVNYIYELLDVVNWYIEEKKLG